MFKSFVTTCALIDASSLIYALLVLSRVSRSTMRESERRPFRFVIGSFMWYSLADLLLMLSGTHLVSLPTVLLWVVAAVGRLSGTVAAYSWALYAHRRMGYRPAFSRRFERLAALPALVVVGVVMMSAFTGVAFTLTANGYFQPGPLYHPIVLVDVAYPVFVAVTTARLVPHAGARYRRREMLGILARSLPTLLSLVISWLVPGVSVVPAGLFCSMFMEYVSLQDGRINVDALTGLNNRRRTDEFLATRLHQVSPERPICLFFFDIDHFKQVNDRLGHIEGDWALQIVADALRQTAARVGGFVSRWGGDEFVLACDAKNMPREGDKPNPAAVASIFRQALAGHHGQRYYDSPIRASVGWVWGATRDGDPGDLVRAADEAMYREKDRAHCGEAGADAAD